MSNCNIFFINDKSKSACASNQISSIMKAAFISLKQKNCSPKWIDQSAVFTEKFNSADLFVFETFSGNAFDFLKQSEHRILSPFVIKYLDSDSASKPFQSIPQRPLPIFSQCMRGLSVTCTNLPTEVKNSIEQKVTQMCGLFDSSLSRDINFLVSDSVLTVKYRAAINFKTKVMKADWVFACWDRYQYQFERADSEHIVSQYLLPIFHGLTITVSQIDVNERNQIKDLVNSNGGSYQPALIFNIPNTILLLREQSGEKYKFAKLKKIPCVRVEWLYHSIQAKYALPRDNYLIDEEKMEDFVTISKIQNSVTETSNLPSTSQASAVLQSDEFDGRSLADVLDEYAAALTETNFLDNCVLHAIGFDQDTLVAIKNAARRCGAFYLTQFNSMVTHVIVDKKVKADSLKQFESTEKLVTIHWLIECLKKADCCTHLSYRIDSTGEKTAKKPKTGTHSKPKFDILTATPEEIRKRVNLKSSQIPTREPTYHSSQVRSLADDPDDDMPVVYEPKTTCVPLLDIEQDNHSNHTTSSMDVTSTTVEKSGKGTKLDTSTNSTTDISDENETSNEAQSKSQAVFMFSGFDADVLENLIGLATEKLKLNILQNSSITPEVTHLILHMPFASEKTMSAIAAGIWILKPEFIHDSVRRGYLASEGNYQWGLNCDQHLSVLKQKLVSSSFEWRAHISRTKEKAFHDWTVLVLNNTKALKSCVQILKSGDAEIYFIDEYDSDSADELQRLIKRVRFAVIDLKFECRQAMPKARYMQAITELAKRQKIIRYEFISRYIMDGPGTPHPERFLVTGQQIREELANVH